MGKFYHFGDSFTKGLNASKSFGKFIADHFSLEYFEDGHPSESNDQILYRIIEHLDRIVFGDIVLINFSFLTRYLTVDDQLRLTSTAGKLEDDTFFNDKETILDYYLGYNYEYNLKLFVTIKKVLNILHKRGVKVYCVFLKKEDLVFNNKVVSDGDFNLSNELKFEPTFYDWLINKGWMNEEDGHYTFGIQEQLTQEYIKRMNDV